MERNTLLKQDHRLNFSGDFTEKQKLARLKRGKLSGGRTRQGAIQIICDNLGRGVQQNLMGTFNFYEL